MRVDHNTEDAGLLAAEVRRLAAALDDATAEIARLRDEVERLRASGRVVERIYRHPDGGGMTVLIRPEDPTPTPPQEPQPVVQPVTAQPGKAFADAAYRAGREDEYSDLMRTRAGGEW